MGWSGGHIRIKVANGRQHHAAGILDDIKPWWTLWSASSLWHTSTVARSTIGRQAGDSALSQFELLLWGFALGRGFERFAHVTINSVGPFIKLLLECFGLLDLFLGLRHESVHLAAGYA